MHKVKIIIGFDKATVIVEDFTEPMDGGHFLEKVQLLSDNKVISEKLLKAGDSPKNNFDISTLSVKQLQGLKARVFCNLHGVFES